jgi:ATP-dependent Clp protease ATP-binding subunit ClpA
LQAVSEKRNQNSPQKAGMKISPEFRELLQEGLKHARENGRRVIESIDILFGLFCDTGGSIARTFRKLGADRKTVLQHVEDLNKQ